MQGIQLFLLKYFSKIIVLTLNNQYKVLILDNYTSSLVRDVVDDNELLIKHNIASMS